MLSIWIGRAGSGKSEKVLRTIAAERTQRAQVLIVPEHTSHRAEVDLCRACGETGQPQCRGAELPEPRHARFEPHGRSGGRDARRRRKTPDDAPCAAGAERAAQGVPPPVPARGISAAAGGAGGGVLCL